MSKTSNSRKKVESPKQTNFCPEINFLPGNFQHTYNPKNKLEDKVKFRFFENRFVFLFFFLLPHTQNSMQQTTRLTAAARFRFQSHTEVFAQLSFFTLNTTLPWSGQSRRHKPNIHHGQQQRQKKVGNSKSKPIREAISSLSKMKRPKKKQHASERSRTAKVSLVFGENAAVAVGKCCNPQKK